MKSYIQPAIMAYDIKVATIMALSEDKVEYAGSNKGQEGTKTAESKQSGYYDDCFDILSDEY